MKTFCTILFLCIVQVSFATFLESNEDTSKNKLKYINTAFENASPLDWTVDSNGVVTVGLIYDHERNSINRANGHWHYKIEAEEGAEVTIVMKNFENYWNGRLAYPVMEKTNTLVSKDRISWKAIPTKLNEDHTLTFTVKMEASKMFLASVEPYRLSDLEKLLNDIKGNRNVQVEIIGKTVEGRPLEMVRIGNPKNKKSIVLRARAHPWEAGGNWVAEGLIKSLLKPDGAKYLNRYCIYIMPIANKDGVARGRTRFNMMGMDLNRQWDREPDPVLVPEKHAFENWLKKTIASGNKPILAIDLHNDNFGNLHVNLPTEKNKEYTARMLKFEELLRKHTWFREGKSHVINPGSFGEGLAARYGVDACVYEFNYDWIEGLQKDPSARDWLKLGEKVREVFWEYVAN